MKVAMIGTGYVGLVTGTCFAATGNNVICVDVAEQKIENLKKGIIPIYEPGLEQMVKSAQQRGNLKFTTDIKEALKESDICFIAVGTPMGEDGSADLQYVMNAAREIGQYMIHDMYIVDKSTVPVGTGDKVKAVIQEELDKRGVDIDFDVASNPEFLKEGAAIKDFMSPDRVVIGVDSERAKIVLERLYRPFLLNSYRIIFMDIPSAEMTKYAANAMLATRISFMNDISNLCDLVGANVNSVRKGIGADVRIGNKFLYSGCGYGGSCFPKDVKALLKTGEEYGYEMSVIKGVEKVNERQKHLLFDKLKKYFGYDELRGMTVALWGLAFKPETDDMREAPALVLIRDLVDAGCFVRVYDPIAMNEGKRRLGGLVYYASDLYDALDSASALMLVTEWKAFRLPAWNVVSKVMSHPLILDGRNIYNREELEAMGFVYEGIGQ